VSENSLTEARRRLADASADVAAARKRLRESQEAAWERYLTEVKEALSGDLELPDPAGDEAASTEDVVHELLEAVRSWVDELRLHAHLGRMEVEEVTNELREKLGAAVNRLR
jgi:hypothetical protein